MPALVFVLLMQIDSEFRFANQRNLKKKEKTGKNTRMSKNTKKPRKNNSNHHVPFGLLHNHQQRNENQASTPPGPEGGDGDGTGGTSKGSRQVQDVRTRGGGVLGAEKKPVEKLGKHRKTIEKTTENPKKPPENHK